ncbi:MAG: hypothetical protein UU47_C0007G0026 [candidate division TM6 bacterium GW2011_GWE2_41_16]|nr:MAG: hypothetical protein UU47_C0007G0026 [candidate division TM6 bacterium GW2011_GWE2_41_16]
MKKLVLFLFCVLAIAQPLCAGFWPFKDLDKIMQPIVADAAKSVASSASSAVHDVTQQALDKTDKIAQKLIAGSIASGQKVAKDFVSDVQKSSEKTIACAEKSVWRIVRGTSCAVVGTFVASCACYGLHQSLAQQKYARLLCSSLELCGGCALIFSAEKLGYTDTTELVKKIKCIRLPFKQYKDKK